MDGNDGYGFFFFVLDSKDEDNNTQQALAVDNLDRWGEVRTLTRVRFCVRQYDRGVGLSPSFYLMQSSRRNKGFVPWWLQVQLLVLLSARRNKLCVQSSSQAVHPPEDRIDTVRNFAG